MIFEEEDSPLPFHPTMCFPPLRWETDAFWGRGEDDIEDVREG